MDKKSLSKMSDLVLESESFRRSFEVDPVGAAVSIGVKGPSTKEMDLLTTLNEHELKKLSEIREKLLTQNPEFGLAAADITGGILF